MAGVEEGFLVSTPLSPLYSQPPPSIPIRTSRQQLPLPPDPSDSDIHPEHATFSTILTTSAHGTLALRLLHSGFIVELVSLSYQVTPIRFVLPAAVFPNVGLFVLDSETLHIIVVTTAGSLHRLVVSIDGRNLWQNQSDIVSPREYQIVNFPQSERPFVHVEGTHSVTIALPNASILRLEASPFGDDSQEDEWTETIFHHGSFLTSLTSFLPLQSGPPGSGDIISMASHPWPTDLGHIWTLSRDRTLRLWKAKVGCVSSKSLSLHGSQLSSSPGASSNGAKQPLLDAAPQSLLKVFSHRERVYVLAFIPATSATSGGVFRLFDTYSDTLHDTSAFESSKNTIHSYLQDFTIHESVLYTLWERQGRSTAELTELRLGEEENEDFQPSWRVASYANEPELTPAYMEEQLLTPGSLTDKYLEALMRPGVFSSLTLKTAIDQYTDTCLSLPSAPPPQLATIYATVEEQIAGVVGCTVNLNRDPQTGAAQHAAYWIALKRDWEGFIARCREIERSARWPLALGIKDQDGVVIVERERIGLLVNEDLPIQLQRLSLRNAIGLDPQYDLLAVLWKLRSEIGPQAMSTVQDRVVDILHQEIAFGFADILQDQARRVGFKENFVEGSAEWFSGRLQSVGDLDTAVRTALDVIGGFDDEVKHEEEDATTLLTTENPSELSTGLTVAYIMTSISARHDLCLSLITLLFFIADDLSLWDPSLLAEVFAVFRGISMLQQIASQPARPPNRHETHPAERAGSEDVILRMRNMNFSNGGSVLAPRYSLIHLFLSQVESKSHLPGAAHRFLDSTGLLRSVSPSNATQHEVLLCEKVRLLGLHDVARDLLAWLPRTPGAVFVLASVWLQLGRPADSAELLEKLASSFGPDSALSQEDREALLVVMPSARVFESSFAFYIHASEMFKNHLLVYYEVLFAQLAISTAPPGVDTSTLWYTVIKGYLDLGQYDDAYAALMATPHERQKRECVSQLTFQMCENDAIAVFMSFDFAGIAKEVEAALSFKARNAEPNSRPAYAHILYTWYVQRGNYRDGALVMYQQAQKLAAKTSDVASFVEIAQAQLEAITIAINALSLIDSNRAWIVVPKPNTTVRNRRVTLNHVPDNKFSSRRYDAEIVHLSDMQYDCVLLRAQIDLIHKDPSLLSSQEFLMPPTLIVMRLINMNFYEQALTTARALDVDMTDIFTQLTVHCLRLAGHSDAILPTATASQEEGADWLLTDKASSWSRTPAERGWNYLQQSLERHDSIKTDYRYSKTVSETILTHDKGSTAPPWLIQTLEKHQPEYLIRAALRHERVDLAMEYSLSMLQKTKSVLLRESPRNAGATWLPYNLFDQVLVAAAEQPRPPPRLVELRSELNALFKRLQKLSQESR
ncbi:hypothetical protein P691DRAFT_795643 [Macrolepiota fuliginosa MF-IS2]|uniref:Uncharacterized protein n=1 Tax=Macrolepiota fuliginosa MF-IS2 TaxID=1400762 RepID=A0A9P6C4N1_9AGAR|nr:hypothetical protein P691DRAFT_795643 [Macrolepiota fuliginosa MF-IS2]